MDNFTLIFSLISLGFFGGFTHCTGMCGPLVLTQVSNRLQKMPLEKFSNLEKLKNLALLPYQLGRITTYATIGFFCSLLNKIISDFFYFRIFSAMLLFLAALIFLDIFFAKRRTTVIPSIARNLLMFFHLNFTRFLAMLGMTALFARCEKIITIFLEKKLLRFKSNFLKKLPFPKKILTNLFQDPQGLKGYFLGLILGFIPCGLLYGAFLIAGAITQPFLALIGMILFGAATFPALFFTASGGYFLFKFEPKKFHFIAKFFMLINAIMLFLMAIKLISS